MTTNLSILTPTHLTISITIIQFCHLCSKGKFSPVLYTLDSDDNTHDWYLAMLLSNNLPLNPQTTTLLIDLVKAFDTIQHQLLFKILWRYGLPDSLVQVIEKLYSNYKVKFECNGIKEIIKNSTGVQQGDNMSPVLFLFIMQAFLDTIKDEILPLEFWYFSKHKNGNQKTFNGHLI